MNQLHILDKDICKKVIKDVASRDVHTMFGDEKNCNKLTEKIINEAVCLYFYNRVNEESGLDQIDFLLYSAELQTYILVSSGNIESNAEKITICYIDRPYEFDLMIEECSVNYGHDYYKLEKEIIKTMYSHIGNLLNFEQFQ